jgi:hypothetical protein
MANILWHATCTCCDEQSGGVETRDDLMPFILAHGERHSVLIRCLIDPYGWDNVKSDLFDIKMVFCANPAEAAHA